ncbi:MAG: beta-ketoacyl synthase [Flavobacteriales bacterium CG_4_9_14_3_um_filter_40_17]|nr:MAG: beta-ketoacyl synthase [Flavobacteriales bacterium CG_4_9_14_3_um_filter_40_17]
MKPPISITAYSSISPLGSNPLEVWKNYQSSKHYLRRNSFAHFESWVGSLHQVEIDKVTELKNSNPHFRQLDLSVLYAIFVSRNAIALTGWSSKERIGVNFGSSRGATALFEKYHREYIQTGRCETVTSPTTTLGNISSWVAHDLQISGPDISHSITCSTALHALLNGVAWLRADMADKFLVGGSEASLTGFTIAQMRALKIYAKTSQAYPCKAFDLNKEENSMVLGEGAAVFCLEKGVSEKSIALVEGLGYATEVLTHPVSISTDARCFQKSMQMALDGNAPESVDVIVMHAPGTIKGDSSEYSAIQKVFADKVPALTSNKWKIGHTFGASGLLSAELALLMMQQQEFIPIPYLKNEKIPKKIQKVMVNAVGFGGNAVSVLFSVPGK